MSQPTKLKKRKAKSLSPPVDPALGASTSTMTPEASRGGITTEDVLQNTSKLLEILKCVTDATQILGPLKAVCGVLKIATDTAILLQSNGEDLKDLIEKLEPQQRFIENEIEELSKPEFSKLENVQGIVEPLWRYLLALKNVHDRLDALKTRYDGGKMKRMKSVFTAQSDQDQIASYTLKLEDSFRLFMNCVTNFIARQTLLMRDEMAALHKSVVQIQATINEKDALSKLSYISARGNQHESCAEGTRIDMLDGIARWATDANAEPMIALIDQAGTGKSTIAAHMTQEWEQEGSLLARFFFSKPSTVTANGLASTLAKDMTKSVPSLRPLVLAALEEHDDFNSCSLQQQLTWLVFTPLRSLTELRVMVIDALDECSKADRGVFLKSLLGFLASFDAGTCPLKVLLTSRPEDDIVSYTQEPRFAKLIHRVNFSLHSKENASNEDDIRIYITRVFSNYLIPEQCELLVKKANGLFIWASTAQAFVTSALDPTARFEKLMEKDSSLNSLYDDVLNVALESAWDEKEIVMKVLQAICVARKPLTTDMMDELLELRSGIAQRVVIKLSSVLSDGSQGAAIYVLHPTFLEYLQSTPRDPPIVTIPEAEALMAKGCLKVLSSGLKYNICGLVRPGTYRREIYYSSDAETDETDSGDEGIDPEHQLCKSTTPALQYVALSGLSHITASLHAVESVQGLRNFFESKLLNWIELMGWYQEVLIVLGSVHDLKTCIEATLSSTELLSVNDVQWCKDIIGMVQPFQATIEQSPMQVYFSALAFEPSTSNIASWYHPHFAGSIPRVVLGTRSAQHQALVLGGHFNGIEAVAFSPDGRHLASAAYEAVRLWDPRTGAATAQLVGSYILTTSFSPDGRYLSSAWADETVKVWDASTSAVVRTVAGHNVTARCVALSTDGQRLASGRMYGSAQVWDVDTGAVVCTLTGLPGRVKCIAFSPNGQQLASGSIDCIVQIWDASTGALVHTLAGHTDIVQCVAFSPNGRQLASASNDKMVRMWDASTGATVHILAGHTGSVHCVAFSHNGRQLASGSWDRTVQIWDISTGVVVQTLAGHTGAVLSVAFSPNGHQLAAGSLDYMVRVWDVGTGEAVHRPATRTTCVTCCAFSPCGLQLATGSLDGGVWIWDSRTGVPIGNPLPHSGLTTSMYYYEWQGAMLLVVHHSKDNPESPESTVWNMSVTPPSLFSTHLLLVRPTSPAHSRSLFRADYWTNTRTFIPTADISFYLPSSFSFNPDVYSSHDGRIAYGGQGGSVIIIDCSHLLLDSSAN